MAGRTPNLLPSEDLNLKVSPGLIEYLKQAVATSLYGKTIQEAADRLISQGLERLIDQDKIGPIKQWPLREQKDEDEA